VRTSTATSLNATYKSESDVDVKERILLVRRVISDGKEVAAVCKEELHRSKAWAYKWLTRFKRQGLDGLKDRPRSGRPPDVSEEKLLEIRRELSENPSGWRAKEVMNIIHKKTGVKYHEVHVYRLLHKWNFSAKVPRKRFVNSASGKEKTRFKKQYKKL
jgi:putative transposase